MAVAVGAVVVVAVAVEVEVGPVAVGAVGSVEGGVVGVGGRACPYLGRAQRVAMRASACWCRCCATLAPTPTLSPNTNLEHMFSLSSNPTSTATATPHPGPGPGPNPSPSPNPHPHQVPLLRAERNPSHWSLVATRMPHTARTLTLTPGRTLGYTLG